MCQQNHCCYCLCCCHNKQEPPQDPPKEDNTATYALIGVIILFILGYMITAVSPKPCLECQSFSSQDEISNTQSNCENQRIIKQKRAKTSQCIRNTLPTYNHKL